MVRKKKVVVTKKRTTKAKKEFTVEWVDIDSVKLWEDNPRYNDDAAEKLAGIIKDHGIKSPIVCWGKNRVIYKGNTTYKACKILGYDKVPVVFHDFDSEVAAKAYGIADNKASELAQWDEDLLLNIMSTKEFRESKINTGFSDREVELLDYWPPREEDKKRAKTWHKSLKFRIILEVAEEEYQDAMDEIKELMKEFKTLEVR